jgi:hypothetical protein
VYPTGAVPVYDVTTTNKPGRVIRRISEADALAMMGAAPATRPVQRPSAPAAPAPAPQPESLLARILRWLFAKR